METTNTNKPEKQTKTNTLSCVLVQFARAGKLFQCNAGHLILKKGESVVAETDRGLSMGRIAREAAQVTVGFHEKVPKVVRHATEADFRQMERNEEKEKNAYDICQKKIIEMNLPMKLIRVEFTLGGGKASFYFSSEGRVDFRELVKVLAQDLHTKIEMCQVGVRDEAKMVGGIGICGHEFCCASFLRNFEPVSIKMAKTQNLALNPQKVSGGCGRLLCCLSYEYKVYRSLGKDFPKLGKKVHTKAGTGKVKFVDIFKNKIQVEFEDGTEEILSPDDLITSKTQEGDEE